MTEQEYIDVSDLQLCRAMLGVLRTLNCFDYPNVMRREVVIANIAMIIDDLEPRIEKAMNQDEA